ncbi:MAG: hypothetical protein ACREQ7_10070 [Candidatus Binatia bacterium]
MNGLTNRDTGSDQFRTFGEMQNALSRDEVPLEILSPRQAEAIRRLGELVKLPHNWDSYGSPPPTRVAVETVVELLLRIDNRNLPAARVVPVSGGGVQLEWCVPGRELQLEVSGDGTAQYLKIENGRPTKEEEITPTSNQLRLLLTWLTPRAAERWAA